MRRLDPLLFVTLLATSRLASQSPAPVPGDAPPPNKAQAIAERIQRDVERLRGLTFKEPVKIGVYDKEKLKAFLLATAEKELRPERIVPYERGLKALDLIPADMDFRKTLLDVMNEQVAGFYDPKTKELRLIDRSAGGTESKPGEDDATGMEKVAKAMMERAGVDEDSVIMAHELTHALQDQHFDLQSMPLDVTDDDDLVVAAQSVVEGDATLAMMGWMFQTMRMPAKLLFAKSTAASIDRNLDLSSIPGAEAVANAPPFVKESFLFPYLGGLKFCLALCATEKSFGPVDRALASPPLSTEQVLHPDKYAGGGRDDPMALTLPDLSDEIGLPRLGTNSLGELFTRILLAGRVDDAERCARAAAGWDGDRWVVHGKPGGIDAVAWVTTWDSSEEADEFEAALGAWLAALNRELTSQESDVTSARYLRADGTVDAIARKGVDVILLRGVPKDRIIPTLRKVFEETRRVERKPR
jgi:hypothetical protein